MARRLGEQEKLLSDNSLQRLYAVWRYFSVPELCQMPWELRDGTTRQVTAAGIVPAAVKMGLTVNKNKKLALHYRRPLVSRKDHWSDKQFFDYMMSGLTVENEWKPVFPSAHDSIVESECGQYLYEEWGIWDREKPLFQFIFAQPEPNAERRSRTAASCREISLRLGGGSYAITYAFPKKFESAPKVGVLIDPDPVGDADDHILRIAKMAYRIIVCWGAEPHLRDRQALLSMKLRKFPVYCFKISARGFPQPLSSGYKRAKLQPFPVHSRVHLKMKGKYSGESC